MRLAFVAVLLLPFTCADDAHETAHRKHETAHRKHHRLIRKGIQTDPKICKEPMRNFLKLQQDAYGDQSSEALLTGANGTFHELLPLLASQPATPKRILDVGCGMALYNLLVIDHYGYDPLLHLYLLDKTADKTDALKAMDKWNAKTNDFGFYTSLECVEDTLLRNGVQSQQLHILNAGNGNSVLAPLDDGSFDLIYSLVSWGFHYPVTTYVAEAYRLLRPVTGRLQVDIRDPRGKLELQKAGFICDFGAQRKAPRATCRKPA